MKKNSESAALSGNLRETALRVAKHEAGHYIVSKVLGFEAGVISLRLLDLIGGHSGGAEIKLSEGPLEQPYISGYLRRRIQTLYAGALAEALKGGEIIPDQAYNCWKEGGRGDFDKARELLHLLRNLTPLPIQADEIEKQLTALETELMNEAGKIVEHESEIIEILAKTLVNKMSKINVQYKLECAEINSIPEIIARFQSA